MEKVVQQVLTLSLPVEVNDVEELRTLVFVHSTDPQVGVSFGAQFTKYSEDVSFPTSQIVFITEDGDSALEDRLLKIEERLEEDFNSRAINLLLQRIKSR